MGHAVLGGAFGMSGVRGSYEIEGDRLAEMKALNYYFRSRDEMESRKLIPQSPSTDKSDSTPQLDPLLATGRKFDL